MEHSYRRVVPTRNAKGKSVVATDTRIEPGPLWNVDFWKTTAVPASLDEDGDAVVSPNYLVPPEGGTSFTFFEIPPQNLNLSPEQAERAAAEAFAAAGAEQYRLDTKRNPMMHATPTIDYVVLLRGEVTMLLDEEEIALKPFDTVVQRATNHTWINHGEQPALFMSVLLSAE
jgi:hypothetical protein